ncbi:MAG: cbb3-type cytochrome c oxidase subunit I [Desulfobacteraceae bacterium]|nr:cbb3-type cytochrome c oxidase subunit I [Desulfobacteraceae bacterium]
MAEGTSEHLANAPDRVSPRWKYALAVIVVLGMAVLIYISARSYSDAPPVPEKVVGPAGQTVFTESDIWEGQQVFLKYGLMDNGSIWGHGAYLGPDFSAEYLHTLGFDASASIARSLYGKAPNALGPVESEVVSAEVMRLLRENRYDPGTKTLSFTRPEVDSFRNQIAKWTDYFKDPKSNGGLRAEYIKDPEELRKLTAFFAWAAWACVANRPGQTYSYTGNFPYDPLVGNVPTGTAIFWSMMSIIWLMGGTALVLFAFGRYDYLGWKSELAAAYPRMVPGKPTDTQRATIKFFFAVSLLFLAQVLVGGGIAHFRADPGNFYGFNLSEYFPSNILRTWHLQLAMFWIASSYVAGALLLAPSLGGLEPKRQTFGIHLLFWAFVIVIGGSLLGEIAGINQQLGALWFWLGHQGWEFLELGRFWQVLLAIGLLFWLVLLYREVAPALKDPGRRELSGLFLLGALMIPLFYLPAFFFGSSSNFAVVDTWRFWIIHLWVEGFLEIFVTILVALTFVQLGLVSTVTAVRVIYLDAILFLAGGIVGTAHHWYWTGQSSISMAFAAMYSALEVVPLTLLTLDAGDFIKLGGKACGVCGKPATNPHRWGFYFLLAVGFWNFVGAGIFGFLINLPIVSYFEVGTVLTPNHGHSALMGAFGMLGMALIAIALRQVSTDEQWVLPEKLIKTSFWGLNAGLALMVIANLFPGGVMQVRDVLQNGYWHARSLYYLDQEFVRMIEWARMPGDTVFIVFGVIPAVIAAGIVFFRNASRAAVKTR